MATTTTGNKPVAGVHLLHPTIVFEDQRFPWRWSFFVHTCNFQSTEAGKAVCLPTQSATWLPVTSGQCHRMNDGDLFICVNLRKYLRKRSPADLADRKPRMPQRSTQCDGPMGTNRNAGACSTLGVLCCPYRTRAILAQLLATDI
jgi:hypothetical protein